MKCLCCGSINIVRKGEKSGYSIYKCNNCGFQFVYPLPAVEDVREYYNLTRISNDIKTKVKSYINTLEKDTNCPKRDWFENVLSLAVNYSGHISLDILEIGSAYGYFVHFANTNGHNAIGTEVSQEYAAASKGIIKGEVIYVENSQYDKYFGEKMFDLVYLEHVFEHIIDPLSLTEFIRKCLKNEGILFLSLPNHSSLLARLLKLRWKWTCPPDHLYYYNKSSLKELLISNGMKILQAWTGDYYFRSIYQFYSLDIFWMKAAGLSNKYFNTKFKIQHLYKYPETILQVLNLLPYWMLYPVIKIATKLGMGSELVIVAGKANL